MFLYVVYVGSVYHQALLLHVCFGAMSELVGYFEFRIFSFYRNLLPFLKTRLLNSVGITGNPKKIGTY